MADLAYNLTTYFNGCFFDALDNRLHVMVTPEEYQKLRN